MFRLLTHLILAIVLLLGQQAVLSHALMHVTGGVTDESNPDKPIPTPDNCEKCASLSQLQAAVGTQQIGPGVLFTVIATSDTQLITLIPVFETSYLARGPPVITQT